MTVDEIAALLRVSTATVRKWTARGELPAVHIGRRARVTRSDLDDFIAEGTSQPPRDAPAGHRKLT